MSRWQDNLPKTNIKMSIDDEPPEAWDRAYNSGTPKEWKEERVKQVFDGSIVDDKINPNYYSKYNIESIAMSKKKYIYAADVVRIIDGDSIVLKADLGFDVWINKSFRLNGIDTPESRINIKKYPERTKEKELGLKAKERLKVLCGKKVIIEVVDKGKYGRPLINIFTGEAERDICKILIEEGLAIKYQGEKKTHVW